MSLWKLDQNLPAWMKDDYLMLHHQLDTDFQGFSSSIFQLLFLANILIK